MKIFKKKLTLTNCLLYLDEALQMLFTKKAYLEEEIKIVDEDIKSLKVEIQKLII